MWVILTLTSALLYTAQWAVIRASHQKIPSSLMTAAHHIFGPILMLGLFAYPLPLKEPLIIAFLIHAFIVNPPFSWLSVHATQKIPVTISKPLSSFASVSATFVGWLIFKTEFPPLGILGIVLGFIGLWLLYHGNFSHWKQPHPWILALCMLNFGILATLMSQVMGLYPHPVIMCGLSMTGALSVSFIGSLSHRKNVHVSKQTLGMLGFIAISNIFSEIIYVMALGMIPAAYAVSTKRMSIIFTALLGFFLFRERTTPFARLMTATLMVAGGVVLMVLR